jgi:hypothetical protein
MPSLDELGAAMAKELRAPRRPVIRERVYSGEICQQLFGVDEPFTKRSAEWTHGSSRIDVSYSSCRGRPIVVLEFKGRDRKFFRAAMSAAKSLHGSIPGEAKQAVAAN